MKQKIGIWLLALVLVLSGCAAQPQLTTEPTQPKQTIGATKPQQSTKPTQQMPEETQPTQPPAATQPLAPSAPDFTVYDRDGQAVNLSDFVGKPVVLNFWASWCGPCKGEMPDFQDAYERLGDEVQFLMVNLTDGKMETVESVLAFLQGKGYTFPVFFDTASSAAYAYGISAIPATFFIDAQGHIVARATGMLDAETLQKGIDMILPK